MANVATDFCHSGHASTYKLGPPVSPSSGSAPMGLSWAYRVPNEEAQTAALRPRP